MSKQYFTIAVVGATGLVGRKMLQVLDERNFPVDGLLPVASEKSAGSKLTFKGREVTVITPSEALGKNPRIALFSAGAGVSREWAPRFAGQGCFVADNSSAWRMEPDIPLVVPEINADTISSSTRIIANPNCSTIQMVMALAPLHRKYGIRRLVISTYQSVTGTGKKAVEQMEAERTGRDVKRVYPHPIDRNCLPQCDVFLENGYTKEEMKLVHETRKILQDQSLRITATAVRVPVVGGHSESVNVEFAEMIKVEEVRRILENTTGVKVIDNPTGSEYPMPLNSHERDEVFVGRIRLDESNPNSLNLWIVSDNLRKGAATNAVQIAEYLVETGLI